MRLQHVHVSRVTYTRSDVHLMGFEHCCNSDCDRQTPPRSLCPKPQHLLQGEIGGQARTTAHLMISVSSSKSSGLEVPLDDMSDPTAAVRHRTRLPYRSGMHAVEGRDQENRCKHALRDQSTESGTCAGA